MISLYKRGRLWWVRGSYAGERIRPRSLDTSDKVVAEKRLRALELALDEGVSETRVKWEDFEKEYLNHFSGADSTRKKYTFLLKRFVRFLNKSRIGHLGAITPAVIGAYVEDRREDKHPTRGTPIGQGGIRNDLRTLRGIFNFARQSGYIDKNPVLARNLNSPGWTTQPFEQAEVDKMLADRKSSPYLRAVALMFLHTGMRISDVAGMQKRSVNLKRGEILRVAKKTGKPIALAIHPALDAALRKHLATMNPAQKESTLLFATDTGKLNTSLDSMLYRLFDRCGIEHGHAHRFRDTFAVRLLRNGASLYDVSRLLGITVAVAERHYAPYAPELQERGRRLVSKLDFVQLGNNASAV